MEKGTFISSVFGSPVEEYYLGKNTWSGNANDWKQRFEVGDAIMDPAGDWDPSTAEQYIDQQIGIEASTRLAQDTYLQNQLNIIKKNKVYLTGTTLSQSQINQIDTIYVIKDDLTLTENINIPANCVLEFEGGSISGAYTITGTNTAIQAGLVRIFNTNVIFAGTWNVAEAYPEWFGAIGDGVTDDTNAFQVALAVANSLNIKVNLGGKEIKVSSSLIIDRRVDTTSNYLIIENGTIIIDTTTLLDTTFVINVSPQSEKIKFRNVKFAPSLNYAGKSQYCSIISYKFLRIVFENCYFDNVCMYYDSTNNGHYIQSLYIINSFFENLKDYFVYAERIIDVRFNNNEVESSDNCTLFKVTGNVGAGQVDISQNLIESVFCVLDTYEAYAVNISQNHFEEAYNGILIVTRTDGHRVSNGISFIGNYLYQNLSDSRTQFDEDGLYSFIRISWASNIFIAANNYNNKTNQRLAIISNSNSTGIVDNETGFYDKIGASGILSFNHGITGKESTFDGFKNGIFYPTDEVGQIDYTGSIYPTTPGGGKIFIVQSEGDSNRYRTFRYTLYPWYGGVLPVEYRKSIGRGVESQFIRTAVCLDQNFGNNWTDLNLSLGNNAISGGYMYGTYRFVGGRGFEIVDSDGKWKRADGTLVTQAKSGITANRPTLTNELQYQGYMYFDTTLGKPIYWTGTAWVDSTGATV